MRQADNRSMSEKFEARVIRRPGCWGFLGRKGPIRHKRKRYGSIVVVGPDGARIPIGAHRASRTAFIARV